MAKTQWLEKEKLMPTAFKGINPVFTGLDIGVGIVPHDYLKNVIYICAEPYEEYVDVLKKKIYSKKNKVYIIQQKDWLESISGFKDKSIDSVYLIDVIEHLPKEEGIKLLEMTERIVRQQIIIFTPLGFTKQETLEGGKDAWGLSGAEYQEHKSGWMPEDFNETWNIYACKDYHRENNIGQELKKPFGAFWAIKNFLNNTIPVSKSIDLLPDEIKDSLVNRFSNNYSRMIEILSRDFEKLNTLPVSIVIPVYNGSNYLKEAIDSALAQTYKNIEIIVVNDGSTDNTEEIAKSYGDKIRYFSKENGGVSSALNLALREMKGEYFSWLSHDDVYFPEKIEKQVDFLRKFEDKNVILYSNYNIINENSKIIDTIIRNHKLLEDKMEYAVLRGGINGITLLIPKKAFDDYGHFDEKLKCTQDYAKWFEMMKTYKFVHMPIVLAKHRFHQAQETVNNPNVVAEGNELWIKMMRDLPPETKERLEGSELEFFKQMTFFLKETPYKEAMMFADKKSNEILAKNSKPAVDFTKKFIFPGKNKLKNKIRFAIFSPKKFLKKYLG